MKIINMLPTLAYGDAVANDALAIHSCLKRAGYSCELCAQVIDQRMGENVRRTGDLSWITQEDVVIYHFSIGHPLNRRFLQLPCHKLIKFHNITPPEYFAGYDMERTAVCAEGYRSLTAMTAKAELCLADSEYNRNVLLRTGCVCPIEVLPVLIPFEDYAKQGNPCLTEKMRDGNQNIIFTGRIAPNKRQEDVIAAFYCYKKYYCSKSRLILIGSYLGMEGYYGNLQAYVRKLQLSDVVFTGHIGFADLLSYYRSADLFLCMSDHEGFCVPLVEAMLFGIPIVAKDTSAIAETLGEGGILLRDRNPLVAAAAINRILGDAFLKDAILEKQKDRLAGLSQSEVEKRLLRSIEHFLQHISAGNGVGRE